MRPDQGSNLHDQSRSCNFEEDITSAALAQLLLHQLKSSSFPDRDGISISSKNKFKQCDRKYKIVVRHNQAVLNDANTPPIQLNYKNL